MVDDNDQEYPPPLPGLSGDQNATTPSSAPPNQFLYFYAIFSVITFLVLSAFLVNRIFFSPEASHPTPPSTDLSDRPSEEVDPDEINTKQTPDRILTMREPDSSAGHIEEENEDSGSLNEVTPRTTITAGEPEPVPLPELPTTPTPTAKPLSPTPIEGALFPPGTRKGEIRKLDLGGGASLSLVWIEPGVFFQGSKGIEGEDDEKPQRLVRLSRGFWLGAFEISNKQYRAFRPSHDSGLYGEASLNGDNQPASRISWEEAKAYCNWLADKVGQPVRLPTEAEWEYACRAGTASHVPWGALDETTGSYANVVDNIAKRYRPNWDALDTNDGYFVSSPIGSFQPNDFGVFDMLGNVWEWCEDWYSPTAYDGGRNEDPTGPLTGDQKVLRGGSWGSAPKANYSANRWALPPKEKKLNGFRICIP